MRKGFTLLELLIVIGILAILATATVLVLNPAELLRQARDTQRISDLGSLNSALALYITSVSSPTLGDASHSCANYWFGSFSTATSTASTTFGATCGGTSKVASSTANRSVNGGGWLPVNFGALPGGAPFALLPIDPVNTTAGPGAGAWPNIYGYACDDTAKTFKLTAVLESSKYATNMSNDGGVCSGVYEIGNAPGLNL